MLAEPVPTTATGTVSMHSFVPHYVRAYLYYHRQVQFGQLHALPIQGALLL